MRTLSLAVSFILALPALAVDLSGVYSAKVGNGTVTLTLQQSKDGAVTGTISGERMNGRINGRISKGAAAGLISVEGSELPFAATPKGNTLEFTAGEQTHTFHRVKAQGKSANNKKPAASKQKAKVRSADSFMPGNWPSCPHSVL
jgi:hypothetical protein